MSDLDALQKALAAEHAAVYGYGVAGAHFRGGDLAAARSAYNAHLAQRDRLAAMIGTLGGTPVAAEAAYALPMPVTGAATARALALLLEERVAAVYADSVAASSGSSRDLSARSLYAAAARAIGWRGTTVAFPGAPEQG